MTLSLLLLALFLSLGCHGIEGGRKISRELERQHTVQSKVADQYDCLDIYKQPAFDHVLLKNHKIQMNPSFVPQFNSNGASSFSKYVDFEGEGKGCPMGMVPIPRTQLNYNNTDLRSISKLHLGSTHHFRGVQPGRHFATYYTAEKTVNGAKAAIDLQNPQVKMYQISMSQIWLENGPDSELNSIQVGWAVHPRLYGDNLTRVTSYWTADTSKKTGCYNTDCPGFVQVHPTFHFGMPYPKISVRDGQQYVTEPLVYKDPETGNWWVVFDNDVKIGYYPKEIFTHLNKGAAFIQFGGWTYVSPDGLSPPMGSGLFPDEHFKRSCFFAQIQVIDQNNKLIDIDGGGLLEFIDNENCYEAIYWAHQGGDIRESFTFGEPGGMCGT